MASVLANSLYLVVEGANWSDAEQEAVALGGHLVSINSKEENDFIAYGPLSYEYTNNFNEYWIGLNDLTSGQWGWSSGESFAYQSDFYTDEPSGNNAAAIRVSDINKYGMDVSPLRGSWRDLPANLSTQYESVEAGLAEIPLNLSITTSSTPTEGAGVFTTSINLSAGTETSGNLAEGAEVYWSISGITEDDLGSGALEGSGFIANGVLEIEHSLIEDNDSGESFNVSVFSDADKTQQIGNTKEFAVGDIYDTTPPTISVAIDDGTDGFLNAAEASSASISGATTGAEDGQIVSITITSDGGGAPISATATVTSNSYSTSGLDLSSLGGGTINIAADVEDIAGNSATQASVSSNKIFYPVKKSKKNATLGENQNKLVLTGVKNINGTGSNIGDLIIGNKSENVLKGLLGNDTLMGGIGNDKLQGGGGHDVLKGGSGKDVLKGGWGMDVLNGGWGKDILIGGNGADTYMASNGKDTIHGFNIQQGDLLSGFGDTSELDISDSGKFCIVSGNGYTARLKGVDAADLIAAQESVFV